jgi:MFS family permease
MTALAPGRATPAESLRVGGILVLSLGALDFGLEQSLIIPALPALAEHYGASVSGIAWLAAGFVLASTVAIPLVSRLGDMLGKRRMLLASLAAFAVGSLVCALAESSALAIVGRVVQGFGAAVGPLSYGLARDTVAPERMSRAIGAVVGGASAGGAIGFLLSGLLVDAFSATAVFWFLLVFAVVIAIAVRALVRESTVRADVRLDAAGAVLLGLGLVVLLAAISRGSTWGWTSGRTLLMGIVALTLLGAFALVEGRVRQPLVNLGLVVRRPFASANLCAFAFGYSFFIAVFVVPQIAAAPTSTGYGLALSTTEIGLVLVPTGVASLAGGFAGGRTVERAGPRTLVACGAALGITGYALLTVVDASPATLAIGSGALGLAWGLILTGRVGRHPQRAARQHRRRRRRQRGHPQHRGGDRRAGGVRDHRRGRARRRLPRRVGLHLGLRDGRRRSGGPVARVAPDARPRIRSPPITGPRRRVKPTSACKAANPGRRAGPGTRGPGGCRGSGQLRACKAAGPVPRRGAARVGGAASYGRITDPT